jgi:uncharacterized protein
LHGSDLAFRKLLNAAAAYRVDALICGGDLAGKRLYPIIMRDDGTFVANLGDRTEIATGDAEVAALEKGIADGGGYYSRMSADEASVFESDRQRLDELFTRKVRDRLSAWRRLAEERLGSTGVICYVTGGNDDSDAMLEPLKPPAAHFRICEGETVDVLGFPMVSVAWSNTTPWKTPRETTEDELSAIIERAVRGMQNFGNAIFNFHAPPFDSTLDVCPALDTTTWPPTLVVRGGEQILASAGSTAVKEAILRYQPLLSLHGHIHESTGVVKLGRTTCINPGSEYQNGVLRGVLVTLAGDKVIGYQMTHG